MFDAFGIDQPSMLHEVVVKLDKMLSVSRDKVVFFQTLIPHIDATIADEFNNAVEH